MMEFQSTRPLRGATFRATCSAAVDNVSIHAPLARRDASAAAGSYQINSFNPRAPCEARRSIAEAKAKLRVSIHAPLARRDLSCKTEPLKDKLFQSTRPLRGPTAVTLLLAYLLRFQSTRPLRGAT